MLLSTVVLLFVITSLRETNAGGKTCGWVDVGSVTIRMDSCYVQCQEVTEECWDQKFWCDDQGDLQWSIYRDHSENCGGPEVGKTAIGCVSPDDCQKDSVEAYSCKGSVGSQDGDYDTCDTFHYIDQIHSSDDDSCGFLQVNVQLVANAFFTTDDGKYWRQNCGDNNEQFSTTYCDDKAGTINCRTVPKNVFGLKADHCMKTSCEDQDGQAVGPSLFLRGTPKNKIHYILNDWYPQKWNIVMWTASIIVFLLLIVISFQYHLLKTTKKGNKGYRVVGVDSDSETDVLYKK